MNRTCSLPELNCIKSESEPTSELTSRPFIMTASVKLPEFWPLQASLWFARADAEFANKRITAEATKYSHVIAALPVEVAARVTEEILSPDAAEPYTALRRRLLNTFTLDSYQRACCLLDMPARSGDKPSALLDAMLAFLPEDISRDSPGWLFVNLFLRRLPSEIRAHLMAHTTESVRQLAIRGDALWSGSPAALPSQVHAVVANSSAEDCSPHSCCAVRDGASQQYCWYHANFGADASKCRPPCQWSNRRGNRPGNGRGGRRN